MKQQTAINNFLKLVEKERIRTNRFSYRSILCSLRSKLYFIRPCHLSGYGRRVKNVDYTAEICKLLDKSNIRYKLENDSPRGGLTGNIIYLTHIID